MPTSPLNVYRPVPSLPKGLVRAFPLGCQKAWSGWCSTSPWSSTYFRGCVCVCAHRWDCRAPQALVTTQQNYLAAGLKQTKKKYFFYAEYTYIEELVATGSCKGCKYRKVYQGLGKGAENRSVCEHHL